ncbi:hypothetical protein HanIR_Chr15g0758561 [Helianthus annuus]|nr:hypothetical protein HanIR_Chr15g0758561 [Helianthus annuus]
MVIRSDGNPIGWLVNRMSIRSDGHPIGWPFDWIDTSFGEDVFVYDGLYSEVFVVAFWKQRSISTLEVGRSNGGSIGRRSVR